MKFNIKYHPVWEQTLRAHEKEKYEQFLHQHQSYDLAISTCPIVVKRKKNGGIVATVFICNGLEDMLSLQETTVKVLRANNKTIASGRFTLNFTIPPNTAMPWSFVFQPSEVINSVEDNDNYTVVLTQVE